MTGIFHYMLDNCLEDYVDKVIVMSKEKHHHVEDLRNVFVRCKWYNLWIPPEMPYSVSSRRFLGFANHQKDIYLDPAKTKDIKDMGPPTTCK